MLEVDFFNTLKIYSASINMSWSGNCKGEKKSQKLSTNLHYLAWKTRSKLEIMFILTFFKLISVLLKGLFVS